MDCEDCRHLTVVGLHDTGPKDFNTATLLVGLVVKASASREAGQGFDSRLCRGDFSGSSHTSDLKIGSPVANLPGARRYRVSAGTGWPDVCIL